MESKADVCSCCCLMRSNYRVAIVAESARDRLSD
jgi:hypothetical protein